MTAFAQRVHETIAMKLPDSMSRRWYLCTSTCRRHHSCIISAKRLSCAKLDSPLSLLYCGRNYSVITPRTYSEETQPPAIHCAIDEISAFSHLLSPLLSAHTASEYNHLERYCKTRCTPSLVRDCPSCISQEHISSPADM